jgi:hypothetical protein
MGIGEDIADAFTKPFKPMIDGFKKVQDFFDSLPGVFKEIKNRLDLIKYGFDDIFGGIGDEFTGLGEGLELGVTDIGAFLEFIFIFLGSYLSCGVYFLTNLKGCIFYYLVEVFGQILYLPVRLIVWFLLLFKLNLQPTIDKIWVGLEKLDRVVYKYAQVHIIHYPHGVRQRCYVCKRLKLDSKDGSYKSIITRQGDDVKYDFSPGGGIAQKFSEGTNRINRGGEELKSAFRPF